MKRWRLRTRLTVLNISLMFLVLVPVGLFTYQRESRAMSELLDGRLAQASHTVAALVVHGARRPVLLQRAPSPGTRPGQVVSVDSQLDEPELGYQACDSSGAPVVVTADFEDMALPTDADTGFRTVDFKGAPWRLYTRRYPSGLLVRIGERFDTRQEITRALVLEHSLPLILGIPLLALLISFAVRGGLLPLEHLTRLLRGRTPGNREPVALADATPELEPLIDTLNLQFARLEDALARERRFSADVAHELRTPLAATVIHLETAAATADPGVAATAMSSAQSSLARLARRVEQILAMTRLEIGAATGRRERCDLVAVIKEAIEELAPTIADKDIAFGFSYGDPGLDATLTGHEASLHALFRNLIENALRYVPHGGSVEVTLADTGAALQVDVCDDGPGIPEERRERVFERFERGIDERGDGFGLGLDIVRQAALRHGASIALSQPVRGTGLNVRVTLPRGEAPLRQ